MQKKIEEISRRTFKIRSLLFAIEQRGLSKEFFCWQNPVVATFPQNSQ